jgi:hypothetical protein
MLALREPVRGGALYGPVPHSGGEGGGARSQSNNFEAGVIGKPGEELAHEGADAAARREPAEMPRVDEHGRGHPSDGNRRLNVPDGKPASAHAIGFRLGAPTARDPHNPRRSLASSETDGSRAAVTSPKEVPADPVAWVGKRLSDLEGLLEASVERSETGPTDAEELRIAVPEILEALQRMLDRIRVGELARPLEEAGQPARIGWL